MRPSAVTLGGPGRPRRRGDHHQLRGTDAAVGSPTWPGRGRSRSRSKPMRRLRRRVENYRLIPLDRLRLGRRYRVPAAQAIPGADRHHGPQDRRHYARPRCDARHEEPNRLREGSRSHRGRLDGMSDTLVLLISRHQLPAGKSPVCLAHRIFSTATGSLLSVP